MPTPLREGFAPVRDRLMLTLFAAAMLHGMVIAGITFSDDRSGGPAPGLEVIIVDTDVPEAERNDQAAYLAQRTQLGSGTTRERKAARAPASLPDTPPVDATGAARDGQQQATDAAGEENVLTTIARQPTIRYVGSNNTQLANSGATPVSEQRALPAVGRDSGDLAELTGPQRAELWITPDTRASVLAPYLDSWRRRVERMGTMNYPAVAKNFGVQTFPIVEVAIDSNGKLNEVMIRRSSGHPELDQAALQILKLASPFEAFPRELAEKTRRLRFEYEWRFEEGRGAVTVADPQ